MRQVTKRIASFKERVEQIVRDIPAGETLSYGEVARRAGNPNAARAVGMIMSRNTDESVPCHRVVRSDGLIGGYNGILGGLRGAEAKRALLQAEGSCA
ncbi:MAG: MGMT family protein [Patescibacteria group bacterium]|nr:MGMT family protein [Patescibacteria group bacterium]MDE2116335.1 MGMT family protein [Patescibacteria group bacterium]